MIPTLSATEPSPTLALVARLTNDERRALAPYLHMRHYRRGAFLFHVGEVADQLFWMYQGIVKVSTLTLGGNERLLNIFWPGDIFGMICVSRDRRRLGSAQAVAPVSVLTTTDRGLTELLRLRPDLATDLWRDLLDQQRRITLRVEALLNAAIGERLLALLLDLGQRYGSPIQDGYRLAADLTQDDIAHLVGLNRSTTSLLINRYRRDGVLGGHGRQLEIYQAPVRALLEQAGMVMLA
jgi:CRP/FNR family transcriptional regulator, cyclic AMP receptor protein